MILEFMALVTAVVHMVSSQQNRVLQQGQSEDPQSVIVTTKTTAFLSCESGDMVVKVNFTQPFKGIIYAHRSRRSPCRVYGSGGYYYELRIPLKGCGTWQESPRVFVNNITIRFHSALELEEDETKTVVCRYPPPLTQPPDSIIIEPPNRRPTPNPPRVSTAKLSEVEILILICLLLFLSLLTLGIGIAYFCLRRRNIHIVRKTTPYSSAPPSQITRLSGSGLHAPSSMLSSVLGHTIRIPRAVPYSVPPGRISALSSPYEEGSSATETTTSETSATSSDDVVDSSRNLLYAKSQPRSILHIPKAILRKTGSTAFRTQPSTHRLQTSTGRANLQLDKSTSTTARRSETEDQVITTVLGSENQADEDPVLHQRKIQMKDKIQNLERFAAAKSSTPVYAKVDKNRKLGASIPVPKDPASPEKAFPLTTPELAAAKRHLHRVIESPEERKTSEEVTQNSTVTTSVTRELTERKISSPALEKLRRTATKGEVASPVQKPKSILIRDVADVYVTTTVETELRELTTTVSKDTIEQHAKTDSKLTSPANVTSRKPEIQPDPKEMNWSVIIRQQKPASPVNKTEENNSRVTEVKEPKMPEKPQFDVKIRSIPPQKMKDQEQALALPPLDIPEAVSRLKEVLDATSQRALSEIAEAKTAEVHHEPTDPHKDKPGPISRPVRRLSSHKEEESSVNSTDSYQSAESLRERSSSEVLEVAPTLSSQQRRRKSAGRASLERSTSEIVTGPDDYMRWVGGVVPVLENLSPEFLANIPVVLQGGFFHKQQSTSTKNSDQV